MKKKKMDKTLMKMTVVMTKINKGMKMVIRRKTATVMKMLRKRIKLVKTQ